MAIQPAHAETESQCQFVRMGSLPIVMDGSSVTIESTINGQSVKMAVDTGASSSSLFQHAADKLDLPMGHLNEMVVGLGGDSEQYLATIKNFGLGPLKAKSLRLRVIREYAGGISEGGLIGADFLMHHDIELSLHDQKITFFNPVKCQDTFLAYWDDNAFIADLESPRNDGDQSPVVNIELNGKKMRAMIDTGAAISVVSLEAAARAGIAPQSPNVVKHSKMGGIGVAVTETWVAPFDSFSIGDEMIQHPKIVIGDLWSGIRNIKRNDVDEVIKDLPEMLLGMDFIRAHRLLFANSQRHLYFSYLGGPVFYTEPPKVPDNADQHQ